MFIPDPDLDFFSIPDPGVNKAPDPGSRIRNTTGQLTPPICSDPLLQCAALWNRNLNRNRRNHNFLTSGTGTVTC
jgi:hypothetical protein